MDCVHKMMDRAIEMEGTVSGEHAIGLGKKVSLPDGVLIVDMNYADPTRAVLWTSLVQLQYTS